MAEHDVVAVLGAGSWGTALAKLISDKGIETRLWGRRADQLKKIQETRENADYLPGIQLAECLTATGDIAQAMTGATACIGVIPTQSSRAVLKQAAPFATKGIPVISATKGIENSTLELVSQIYEDFFDKEQLCFLGGPSFAKEVATKVPTAVCIGGFDAKTTQRAQQLFSADLFRVYTTDDVTGVEIGGALKNVVAIAAGVADGLGFGQNTRAALITRGLAEITRLAVKLGANPLTLAGLSGMGDLVLTCCGDASRNRRVGLGLGQGKPLDQILDEMKQVAEGVRTAKSAHLLAAREGVEMPITNEVYSLLYEGKSPKDTVASLMMRPLRSERE